MNRFISFFPQSYVMSLSETIGGIIVAITIVSWLGMSLSLFASFIFFIGYGFSDATIRSISIFGLCFGWNILLFGGAWVVDKFLSWAINLSKPKTTWMKK